MTFPALSKNYCTRANAPVTDYSSTTNMAKNIYWIFKEALKDTLTTGTFTGTRHANSVWTVVGSSDGVTAALDGVDRWGTTFDPAKIVGATYNVAHSWIILQNTTLGVQLLIDLNAVNIVDSRIVLTPASASFTLNGTNPRYSPDSSSLSIGWTRSDQYAATTGPQTFIFNLVTTSNQYVSITFTDDGQFFYMGHRVGTSRFTSGCAVLKLSDSKSIDTNTVGFWGGAGGGTTKGWPIATATSSEFNALTPVGTYADTGASMNVFIGGAKYQNQVISLSARLGVHDTVNNKAWWYRLLVWSLNPFMMRGMISDVYWVIHPGVGASLPNVPSQTHIMASYYAIPFIGAQPIMI